MDYIDNPKEDENHHTFLPYLELIRVNMMILDSRLGAFSMGIQ
jgi:hypothetical protein